VFVISCRTFEQTSLHDKMHRNNFSGRLGVPDFVPGEGLGNSEAEALNVAQKEATNNISKVGTGIDKRHCDSKCEKR
jgi:hypothetical protein